MFSANIIRMDRMVEGHTNNTGLQSCDVSVDRWEAVAKDLLHRHSGTVERVICLSLPWQSGSKESRIELQPVVGSSKVVTA